MPPDLRDRALSLWAGLAGIALFLPALGLPGLGVPLQPLDLIVLAGWPILLAHWPMFDRRIGWISLALTLSLLASWRLAGGQALVLAHGLLLALPFVLLIFLVARSGPARAVFLRFFLWGGGASIALFLAQIAVGAQRLDFRSNTGFSLPAQYGRGFALFPEVSTFAIHANLILAICLVMALHALAPRGVANRRAALLLAALAALMLTRSTSFLLIAPVLCTMAVALGRQVSPVTLVRLFLAAGLIAAVLALFLSQFYVDRLDSAAATRSAQMRLASILAGLSPLWSGEVFGVGLGNNHEIARRAHDIAHTLGLRFVQLPKGVNSQLVARIFEEGWPALLGLMAALPALVRALPLARRDPVVAALVILATGSFLSAAMVTGYRAIYTNWLWLGLPAGLLAAYSPVRRRTTPIVRHRMARSTRRQARRA